MTSQTNEAVHSFPPFFQILKDGSVKRFFEERLSPPTGDVPNTFGVKTKDAVVSSQPKIGVRLFLPQIDDPTRKLPLVFYIHGGGFSIGSAFSEFYTNYVSSLVANSNTIAVSVDYRLAPENPIPACYDDSWEALKWVVSHESGQGPDPWLTNHADFTRIFLAGDSAGATIAHNLVTRVGSEGLGVKITGMILSHPFFGNDEVSPMWKIICPDINGASDPRYNPAVNPDVMGKIGCGKVLVCIGENDFLKERGKSYYEALKKSEWEGEVEIFESKGEGHVFYIFNPTSEKAGELMKIKASFLNK